MNDLQSINYLDFSGNRISGDDLFLTYNRIITNIFQTKLVLTPKKLNIIIIGGFENLVVLKTLKYLDLSDNEISFTPKEFLMNVIVPLKCLPKLTYFNFLSNPIESNFPEIRYLIIYSLPKLQYLNGEKITKAVRTSFQYNRIIINNERIMSCNNVNQVEEVILWRCTK